MPMLNAGCKVKQVKDCNSACRIPISNVKAEWVLADTVLNAKGLEQAELVGQRLSNEGFHVIYCSDLERCKQV